MHLRACNAVLSQSASGLHSKQVRLLRTMRQQSLCLRLAQQAVRVGSSEASAVGSRPLGAWQTKAQSTSLVLGSTGSGLKPGGWIRCPSCLASAWSQSGGHRSYAAEAVPQVAATEAAGGVPAQSDGSIAPSAASSAGACRSTGDGCTYCFCLAILR